MIKVANYKDIDFNKRKYNKNELIFSTILKGICLILSSFGFYFFINNNMVHFKSLGDVFSYYEAYAALLSIIMYVIFFIYELYFLITKINKNSHAMYILKFINLMSLICLYISFFLLLPAYMEANVVLKKEIYIYVLDILLPIFSLLDFIFFDYYFFSNKKYAYYGLTLPTIYLFIFLILRLFFSYKWPSLIEKGHACDGPYPFLDSVLNSWFITNYKNADIKKGIYGFSIFEFILIMGFLLVFIGAIIIHLKNKRLIKKYDIIIESKESRFQDF